MKAAFLPLAASAFFAATAPAVAQPPERTTSVIVYGDDKCPQSVDPDEIVVCGKRSESERYRIPLELREDRTDRPDEVAWGSRLETLEDAARSNLPGSCTPVGSYGQTGCRQKMIDAWYQERAAAARRRR